MRICTAWSMGWRTVAGQTYLLPAFVARLLYLWSCHSSRCVSAAGVLNGRLRILRAELHRILKIIWRFDKHCSYHLQVEYLMVGRFWKPYAGQAVGGVFIWWRRFLSPALRCTCQHQSHPVRLLTNYLLCIKFPGTPPPPPSHYTLTLKISTAMLPKRRIILNIHCGSSTKAEAVFWSWHWRSCDVILVTPEPRLQAVASQCCRLQEVFGC
jgi:hypothetical protein